MDGLLELDTLAGRIEHYTHVEEPLRQKTGRASSLLVARGAFIAGGYSSAELKRVASWAQASCTGRATFGKGRGRQGCLNQTAQNRRYGWHCQLRSSEPISRGCFPPTNCTNEGRAYHRQRKHLTLTVLPGIKGFLCREFCYTSAYLGPFKCIRRSIIIT